MVLCGELERRRAKVSALSLVSPVIGESSLSGEKKRERRMAFIRAMTKQGPFSFCLTTGTWVWSPELEGVVTAKARFCAVPRGEAMPAVVVAGLLISLLVGRSG